MQDSALPAQTSSLQVLVGINLNLFANGTLRCADDQEPGRGGWIKSVRSGDDDYARVLNAWGERALESDQGDDRYCEVIRLYAGVETDVLPVSATTTTTSVVSR